MWFIAAIIVATGVTALAFWLRSKGTKFAWYEVLIFIIGIALLLFGIQNYFGFDSEFQSEAATQSLVIIGLPALLILGVAGALVWRRNRKTVA